MKKINFQKIAKKVIYEEIIAIKKLKRSINHNFDKAVQKILNRKNGKVIFSGTGKSGAAGSILSVIKVLEVGTIELGSASSTLGINIFISDDLYNVEFLLDTIPISIIFRLFEKLIIVFSSGVSPL